jgi:hypothetical protein
MKNVLHILTNSAIVISAISCLSACDEEKIDSRGVVLVTVLEGTTNTPVSNAAVKVYPNLSDWSDDVNAVASVKTDNNGEVFLPRLPEGTEYIVDVTKGALSNWNYPSGCFIEDGELTFLTVYVTENFNTLISQIGGKTWTVTGITNQAGEDVSDTPGFSCLIGNRETFHKSGYYEIDRGPSLCNPDPAFSSGSWWNDSDYSLYIFSNISEEFFSYVITDRSADSFTIAGPVEGEEISLHYQLNK